MTARDDRSRQVVRNTLLADLASARADLVEILTDTLRKLFAARSGLAIASMAGLDPDTTYEVGDDGPPMSPVQLSDLIERFESKETQIRELLAQAAAKPGRPN